MAGQPPLKSPEPHRPDRSDEPTTGEWMVAKAEDLARDTVRSVEKKGFLTSFVGFVGSMVGAIGIVFGAYTFVISEARAQVDAGVKVIDQKTSATQAELTRYQSEANARFERLEHQGDRTERKMDALLDRFHVDNPAPRPDGGTQ